MPPQDSCCHISAGAMEFRSTSSRPFRRICSFRRFLRPVGACHRRLRHGWTASPPLFHCAKLVAPARRVPHLTALAAFRCHPDRLASCPARGSAFSPGSPPCSHSLAQGNAAGMLPGQESKGLLKCYKLKNQAEAKVVGPVAGRIAVPERHPTVPGKAVPAPATAHAVRPTCRSFRIPLR